MLALSATLLATSGKRVTCTVGNNVEMKVIAAVVVGGTSAVGGLGNIYGTALGALLLAIISPALTQLGIDTNWTDFFTGVIIVAQSSAAYHRQRAAEPGKDRRKEELRRA